MKEKVVIEWASDRESVPRWVYDGFDFVPESAVIEIFNPDCPYKRHEACIWDGWDAALILSGQDEATLAVTRDDCSQDTAEKGNIQGAMAADEYENGPGKRKAKGTPGSDWGDIITRKLFRMGRRSWKNEANNDFDLACSEAISSASNGGQLKIRIRPIAKAVAELICNALLHCPFLRILKEVLTESSYESFERSLLKSFAKFVLSVFDADDFERIYEVVAIRAEYAKLSSWISKWPDRAATEIVAEARAKYEKFPSLREHDFCDVLRQHERVCKGLLSKVEPWSYRELYARTTIFRGPDVRLCAFTIAVEEIKNFVPLKEKCKTQLTLELMHRQGYHIFDTLFVEAFKDIHLHDSILGLRENKSDVWNPYELDRLTGEELVTYCLGGVGGALYSLGCWKSYALNHSEDAVAFAVSAFRPCTKEVFKVIEIANHERRVEGQPFISLQHFLFGLSLSRVCDCLKIMLLKKGLQHLRAVASRFSMLNICRLSREAAFHLGHKRVGLEHLVLALVFGKQAYSPNSSENIKQEYGPNRTMAEEDISWTLDTSNDAIIPDVFEWLSSSDGKSSVERLKEDTSVFSKFLPEDCRDGRLYTVSALELSLKLECSDIDCSVIRQIPPRCMQN